MTKFLLIMKFLFLAENAKTNWGCIRFQKQKTFLKLNYVSKKCLGNKNISTHLVYIFFSSTFKVSKRWLIFNLFSLRYLIWRSAKWNDVTNSFFPGQIFFLFFPLTNFSIICYEFKWVFLKGHVTIIQNNEITDLTSFVENNFF